MANVLSTLFGEIANAIRGKTGDMATMKPAEFPAKIASIESGGGNPYAEELVDLFLSRDSRTGVLDFTALEEMSLPPYSFAGFAGISSGVEGMIFSKVALVLPESLAKNRFLKVLDITLHPQLSTIGFYQQSLVGCTALESIIVRDGGAGISNVSFHITSNGYDNQYTETGHGGNKTFRVYVPRTCLELVRSNVMSSPNASVSADRFYAIEDYPEIDNWRSKYTN